VAGQGFHFASGNARKLLAVPKYVLAAVLSWFVPRVSTQWVFGSGLGFGEGARAVARTLREEDLEARIVWLALDETERALAEAAGFESLLRQSWAGFWATLRGGHLIVTHGLGDVNRFGVFGGQVTNLIHGAPLKKLHLDSAVTTEVRGPAFMQAVLRRMYLVGTKQIALFVAGSVTAAERLRSAYQVDPGRVRVLGDPRDDVLSRQVADPLEAAAARTSVQHLLGFSEADPRTRDRLVLYAPTWRDGAPDPAVPSPAEIQQIHTALDTLGARLVIRSHPLGGGAYSDVLGDRVHMLGGDLARDITPLLGAFDVVVTDYSSIAIDFSLFGRPIVWFAPDLDQYVSSRGLYEPLEVTAAGRVQRTWAESMQRLSAVLTLDTTQRRTAEANSRALASRFHAHPEGGAASRVIAEIRRLSLRDDERFPMGGVFFESFYGRQVSCNPLALDHEITARCAGLPRYWSVVNERIEVPEGAIALLVGSPDWFAARRRAQLLVVNDWLRYRFRRGRHQTVLQTWHGTMLKRLALARADTNLRTRIAIRRESRRWSILLSQNAHSSEQFRSSYAFRGELLELGYPRDDRLAQVTVGNERISISVDAAKRTLGVPIESKVLAYVPTWRAGGQNIDLLNVHELAARLGDDWVVVARGHTRSSSVYAGADARVIDASTHADVNDVILAADLLVTDYSSVMFDAAVAHVPLLFFVPDLEKYRDQERGFTFNFAELAPGPMVTSLDDVVSIATDGVQLGENYRLWREKFVPHDDGRASMRVVDALIERGVLSAA
jgi:CDP-glycerol glycerophosphotransferase